MICEKKGGGAFAVLSILAASLFFVLMILAIADAPGWVFGEDLIEALAASDSGVYLRSGIAIGGILLAFGSIGMIFNGGRPGRTAEGVLLMISGILLVWVAFFENDDPIHDAALILVFMTFVLALIASAYDDFAENRSMMFGSLTVLLLVASIGAYAAYGPAMYQVVWIVAAVIWVMARGVKGLCEPTIYKRK
ncbi:MAG: DUF998 domain-containing protein [Candidatus Methanomethylophilaceae archaeon]|jgi:hypothetical membrane protein|nr:DUF998 domain-containing protein [Candidatus Methanomethylophilaceae archaeon]MDD3351647.1 DUF998 domain-containing protein [Candidatus Methanomethylophilaceae archaeon]MDD3986875.1 DUF998 domain-containing protein [Candidatus Methanomethylophilaceae archaeon]MDD4708950.1 DUF998 domain-containing protein [Candidatus Methanomethylophilaceae archaeon]